MYGYGSTVHIQRVSSDALRIRRRTEWSGRVDQRAVREFQERIGAPDTTD